MIESFKHFKSIPDTDFNKYKIKKEDCLKYKEYIGKISSITHFSDITEEILGIITKQNLDKYSYISNFKIDTYDKYLELFSQKILFNYQLKSLKANIDIFVINTSLFWGIDYFGRDKFIEYNNIYINYI